MGEDNLILSLKDFDLLLTVEPNNAIARTERTKTAQLIREDEKNKKSQSASGFLVSGKKGSSSSSSFAEIPRSSSSSSSSSNSKSGSRSGSGTGTGIVGEGVGMAERSSRRIATSSSTLPLPPAPVPVPIPPSAPSLSSSNPPFPPNATSTTAAVTTTTAAAIINIMASTELSSSSAKPLVTQTEKSISQPIIQNKLNKREPIVPSEVPKTLYELERAWRGLRDRPDLFGKYLTQNITKKSTVKKVFKEAISPELLNSVFISLRDFCSVDVILTVLGGLSLLSHFSMTLALFPEEDLTCIKSIFTKFLDIDVIEENKRNSVVQLKELYKM